MKLAWADFSGIFKNFFNIGIFQVAGMLLQLLSVPVIIRKYGLEVFGQIAVATSMAYLLGTIVNYGTNQTAVKDISVNRNNQLVLSKLFSEIFTLRLFVFIIILTISTTLTITTKLFPFSLLLSVLPIILSEVVNPLCFLIGIEKIQWISWGNLLTRFLSILLIYFIFLKENEAIMLNLFVGLPMLLFYLIICVLIFSKYKLSLVFLSFQKLKKELVKNFFVMVNGSSVMLQQSVFLFFVAGNTTSYMLGAYGIIDKLLNATRQLVSAFSSAIFPKASLLYHIGIHEWLHFRTKIQYLYAIASLLFAIILLLFAASIVRLITGGTDTVAISFVKLFSLAPLLLSLNANNVIDLLLAEKYRSMFYLSLVILMATMLYSFALTKISIDWLIGVYPVLMEGSCLLIYIYFLKKLKQHAA
jgi:O-antigen/teichoic acid export membrane protein